MTRRAWMAAVPGAGVSLLPKVVCPVCSAAYAALVSSLGLGFLITTTYLLSLTVIFLTLAVGTLFFSASSRRSLGPFAMGLTAAACIVIGKFLFESVAATYVGAGLLMVASIWNAVPRGIASDSCSLPSQQGVRLNNVKAFEAKSNATHD